MLVGRAYSLMLESVNSRVLLALRGIYARSAIIDARHDVSDKGADYLILQEQQERLKNLHCSEKES